MKENKHMAKIALSYEIPFVNRVTMPEQWAHWLSQRGQKNQLLFKESAVNGSVTWDYDKHGLAPWMQFFYDWRFADLTGDGLIDFILTSGARRQIAYRQDGSVLWAYENDVPSGDGGPGFLDIRLDTNFPVVDIDEDGVPEMICARRIDDQLALCVVNAYDGTEKSHIPFPAMHQRPNDCRASILVANTQGRRIPSDIIVSWDYAYIATFDHLLRPLWFRTLKYAGGRKHSTMGHTPYPADIDGDGCDEIMAGSCLLNPNLSIRWIAPDLPALLVDGHADSVKIVRLSECGLPNVIMSTGGYCFSAEGELLWGRDELKHGQAVHAGRIRSDLTGQQVVIYEGASRVVDGVPDHLVALSNAGELLWDFEVRQPDMQEGGFGFWLGDWNGNGLDEVFVNDEEKVNILDGYGNIIDKIPGHLIYVFDLVGDTRVEAVVLTGIEPGMRMQIWTNDAVNNNPATNQLLVRRTTTQAMYNCTRY
jgi:hypothetical protein